jgi:GWxTD domain-containing protein
MKAKYVVLSIILLFVLKIPCEEKLTEAHKEWLEIVSPIITKIEKEVFLELEIQQDRDRFIQLFWKRRDPLPDTEENEFYKEYMKRISFADRNFGRGTVKRGSQTERGYFYLLLGPPLERQIYDTYSQVWPLELWYYQGDQKYGLPPYFYLLFYQPRGIGEYRLYSPAGEGPEKLVIPSMAGQILNRATAFGIVKSISGELANAALSYIPGEHTLGMTSLSSDILISNARSLAEKKFSDEYARQFLDYKEYVETDYSHKFFDSQYKVEVFKNSGQDFIHWSWEPSQINFSHYQGKYYASFQLIIRIEDTLGNLVLEKEEEIPLHITPEQYENHERRIFAFQDILPIIPGEFKIFFLLKNKTAKDFTSFQSDVAVPKIGVSPYLSPMLLYIGHEKIRERQKGTLKAFAFGDDQYVLNAQNNFIPQSSLGIYCQVCNFDDIGTGTVQVTIMSMASSNPVHQVNRPLEEVLASDNIGIDIPPVPLSAFKPGYYTVNVGIFDSANKKILSEKENFVILSQQHPVVPWIYSKQHPAFPNAEHLFILASQYFLTENYKMAKNNLEQALKIRDDPRIRLLLAKSLYGLGQYQESLALVFPVYHNIKDREATKVIALNYAGLEDWASALIYLEELMSSAVEVSVLNLAAKCYLNLNQPERALPLLEKSLELEPHQENIRDLMEKAKKERRQ